MATGLELLFSTVRMQIRDKTDALVCFFHWCLVANDFKCVGVGDNRPKKGSVCTKSELMPEGWNATPDGSYLLLYQPTNSEDTFLLKIIVAEDTVFINFMRYEDEQVSSLAVKMSEYVSNQLSDIHTTYSNIDGLKALFVNEILDPFKFGQQASAGREPTRQQQQATSPRQQQPRRPDYDDDDPLREPSRFTGPRWLDPIDPFSVGRSDLDPFGGGMGGGMVMDPRPRPNFPHSSGLPRPLPRGAVPPGARFDPFGPPDLNVPRSQGGRGGQPNPYAGPDNDEFYPPGFDDMFM